MLWKWKHVVAVEPHQASAWPLQLQPIHTQDPIPTPGPGPDIIVLSAHLSFLSHFDNICCPIVPIPDLLSPPGCTQCCM